MIFQLILAVCQSGTALNRKQSLSLPRILPVLPAFYCRVPKPPPLPHLIMEPAILTTLERRALLRRRRRRFPSQRPAFFLHQQQQQRHPGQLQLHDLLLTLLSLLRLEKHPTFQNTKSQQLHRVLLHGLFHQSHAMNRMIASITLNLDQLEEHMDTDPLQVAANFIFLLPLFLKDARKSSNFFFIQARKLHHEKPILLSLVSSILFYNHSVEYKKKVVMRLQIRLEFKWGNGRRTYGRRTVEAMTVFFHKAENIDDDNKLEHLQRRKKLLCKQTRIRALSICPS